MKTYSPAYQRCYEVGVLFDNHSDHLGVFEKFQYVLPAADDKKVYGALCPQLTQQMTAISAQFSIVSVPSTQNLNILALLSTVSPRKRVRKEQ